MWLDAIARETDLVVPAPVADREGNLLTVASAPGVPKPRVCALFRWVKGRFCSQHDLTVRHLRMVGRLMGRLQRHSERFVPPAGFTRIRWGADGLLGGVITEERSPMRKQYSIPQERPSLTGQNRSRAAQWSGWERPRPSSV